MKDVSSLMSVIGLLSCHLSSDNMHGTEVQDWLIKICKEQAIGKTALCFVLHGQIHDLAVFYSFFVY